MTFHIALCDDQKDIILMLHKFILEITRDKGINVHIDEFQNPENLLEKVKQYPTLYHLIFLDIEMPQMNGIILGKNLKEKNEYLFIIYITAYDKYALNAFEVGAVDYLMKPVNKNKLKIKLLKYYQIITKLQNINNEFIMIFDKGNYIKVYYKEILYFEKYKNRVKVVCKRTEYNPYMTFKTLQNMIDKDIFIQCNRGTIVHKEKISRFERNDTIIIDDKYNIAVSTSHRKEIKEIFFKMLMED